MESALQMNRKEHKVSIFGDGKISMLSEQKDINCHSVDDGYNQASGFQLKPIMTEAESTFYAGFIGRFDCLLEYGCGGSTLIAVSAGVRKIYSVESDQVWIDKLKSHPVLAEQVRRNALSFYHADIGKTKEWGYPEDTSCIQKWPQYWLGIWNKIRAEEIDCVLVDGRFRVACALYSIMISRSDTILVVHDFWTRRKYHPILKYLDIVEKIDSLGVFSKKADIDHKQIALDLVRYSYATS